MERRGEIIRIEDLTKRKSRESDEKIRAILGKVPETPLIEQLGEQILEFWNWVGLLGEEPKTNSAEIIEFKKTKPVA